MAGPTHEVRSLLVNADDFGLHRDIDSGILDCVEGQRVQSVSFSPTGKSLDWKKLFELQRASVRVGIHITLVGEPWGSDGRIISDWKELATRLLVQGSKLKDAIEREVQWQFQVCEDHGLDPDTLAHIDSHQHIHVLASVWEPCVRLAEQHGIPRVRIPWCPTARVIKRNLAGIALQTVAARRRREVAHFLPCLGLAHAGRNTTEIFSKELQCAARTGHLDLELVAHPGRDTRELKSRYAAWQFRWGDEREALLSDRFIEILGANGYKFARPADLAGSRFSIETSKSF